MYLQSQKCSANAFLFALEVYIDGGNIYNFLKVDYQSLFFISSFNFPWSFFWQLHLCLIKKYKDVFTESLKNFVHPNITLYLESCLNLWGVGLCFVVFVFGEVTLSPSFSFFFFFLLVCFDVKLHLCRPHLSMFNGQY